MHLSHPLVSLIPSLDSASLEVLAGTESGLGTSRIHQLAGRGSRPGHQKVLDRLVEHGLVLSEPTNNGYTYRLNRQHLLVPAVLMALEARHVLLSNLTDRVARLDPQPVHACVFGSVARRESSAGSDIDLFLVMPDGYDAVDEGWNAQLQALEDQVLAWTGNRLEVLVLDQAQLRLAADNEEAVLDSIRDEGVVLHGARFEDLLVQGAPQ